jgi:hypothetical protein
VAKAYREALTKAASLRQAVVDALAAVGTVSPVDVSVMAAIGWKELDLLDHRRAMVAAWRNKRTATAVDREPWGRGRSTFSSNGPEAWARTCVEAATAIVGPL